jgi:hypothetical protein
MALALGPAPLFGFGVMVRTDVLADLLGFTGFLLACRRQAAWAYIGGATLVLSALAKQSAAFYLLAAVIALCFEGRWKRALGLVGGSALAGIVIVVTVASIAEPRFLVDLVGPLEMPWAPANWFALVGGLARRGPELLVLPVVGLLHWNTGGRHEVRPTVLTGVLLVASLATSAKLGADLSYFLGLRWAASWAAGTLWATARGTPTRPGWATAAAGLLALVVFVPSTWHAASQAHAARADAIFLDGPDGRRGLAIYDALFRIARGPSRRLLTDSGFIDIRQGERTTIADGWQFRMLAETRNLHPAGMEARIDAEVYDLIVTTHDLFAADYATYSFGLPMSVVERVRSHYVPAGGEGPGLFYYVPRSRPLKR